MQALSIWLIAVLIAVSFIVFKVSNLVNYVSSNLSFVSGVLG